VIVCSDLAYGGIHWRLLNDSNEWLGRNHKGYKGRLAVEERYAVSPSFCFHSS